MMWRWIQALGVGFGVLAGGWLLAAFFKYPAADSGHVASWAQAFGSIAAVVAAFLVADRQHKNQLLMEEKRSLDQEHRMLLSFRSELESLTAAIRTRMDEAIATSEPDKAVLVRYPVQEDPFAVYRGMVQNLGFIQDHQLRNAIITTYARARGLIQTFRYNNQLIEEAVDAEMRTRGALDDAAAFMAGRTLKNYGSGVRTTYRDTLTEVDALLALLPTARQIAI
jgi:hypothetical protein